MSTLPYQNPVDPVVLLTHLARRKAALRISYTFHGVVLTKDLSLLSFNQDRALVQMGHHWLPTHPGDSIHLHCPDSGAVFTAQVLAINFQSGEVALGDFSLIDRSWVDREHERVQPRQPVHALVRVDDRAFAAPLENISVNGAGVLVYKLLDHGFDLSPGQALKLEFELPQVRARLLLPARLVNIRHHGGHFTCLGMNTYPNHQQMIVLERAINLRKAEIMDELDRVFKQTFQPQSVMELYF